MIPRRPRGTADDRERLVEALADLPDQMRMVGRAPRCLRPPARRDRPRARHQPDGGQGPPPPCPSTSARAAVPVSRPPPPAPDRQRPRPRQRDEARDAVGLAETKVPRVGGAERSCQQRSEGAPGHLGRRAPSPCRQRCPAPRSRACCPSILDGWLRRHPRRSSSTWARAFDARPSLPSTTSCCGCSTSCVRIEVEPPPGAVADVLDALEKAAQRRVIRSVLSGRRLVYAGALAAPRGGGRRGHRRAAGPPAEGSSPWCYRDSDPGRPVLSRWRATTPARRAVAQLVEHRSPKPAVGGSSPSCPAHRSFEPRIVA